MNEEGKKLLLETRAAMFAEMGAAPVDHDVLLRLTDDTSEVCAIAVEGEAWIVLSEEARVFAAMSPAIALRLGVELIQAATVAHKFPHDEDLEAEGD